MVLIFCGSDLPNGGHQAIVRHEKTQRSRGQNRARHRPDWKKKGATIARTYQFNDFPAAIKFVHAVAGIAEQAWHHPDIDIRWNKVTLALTTHDAGGLTEKDFALVRKFDALSLR